WRELDAHCRGGALARYKKPRAYLTMDSLPRNAAGKVSRVSLRDLVIAERDGAAGELQLVDGEQFVRDRLRTAAQEKDGMAGLNRRAVSRVLGGCALAWPSSPRGPQPPA